MNNTLKEAINKSFEDPSRWKASSFTITSTSYTDCITGATLCITSGLANTLFYLNNVKLDNELGEVFRKSWYKHQEVLESNKEQQAMNELEQLFLKGKY